jgi:hypothetical protein
MQHGLKPQQQDMVQEEGNRTCNTHPAAPTARHGTIRRKQNMQHTPCSPDSKTWYKKKETQHATHTLQPRQQDMVQEQSNRTCNTACSPNSKTWYKKKETEHATHALQFRQQGIPQGEGNRTCNTRRTAPTARHATRRKQNMKHTPCSSDSKACHNEKET